MVPLNIVALFSNGLTLALALGFLLIVLWYDLRRELNQILAVFLVFVTVWSSGALWFQIVRLIDPLAALSDLSATMMEIGYTGSSISIYVLTTMLAGIHSQRKRKLAFASLIVVIAYHGFLIVIRPITSTAVVDDIATGRFLSVYFLFYLSFDTITLYLVWRHRRKIRSAGLIAGIALFVFGQSLGFLNPKLQTIAVSTTVSCLGTLVLSFSLVRLEIITPLANRILQVEAMHRVSLAITSQLSIDTVLNEIAVQAVGWLEAQAAAIFLKREGELELASAHHLPNQFLHRRITLGEGVAGRVVATQQSIHVEHYGRDWAGSADLPLARETFGSVICVPLVYGGEVIGALMVIAGTQGRLFSKDDVHLLELLGAQAAVAIAHSRLFAEQRELTRAVEWGRSQLETVLVSTMNPVIAVDRDFHLIFANPAARELFSIPEGAEKGVITDILPVVALPELNRDVLRDLRRNRAHIYEVSLNDRIYLCHLARLGGARATGWVAVLNDVTQLKELDRLKSEMVRWASHDLKNPLTGAMLYVDLLRESLSETATDDVQQAVTIIEKQLERMNRIIRGILDLERLNSGVVVSELCHPAQIVADAVEEVGPLAEEKRIALDVQIEDDKLCFWGDSGQFERALINLVENAIKFTGSGGNVWIKVRKLDGEIVFEVRDTGIGIPEHLHGQIFERFFRGGQGGQRGTEHVSGSGLGLSLVKAIVENHKGRVWVESEEGKGAAFLVALPCAEEVEASHSQ